MRSSRLTTSSKNIDISIDPFTGRNPSYCFVDFYAQEDANQALQKLQYRSVRGRPIKINSNTERKGGPARARPAAQTHADPSLLTRNVKPNTLVFDSWSRDDAQTHWTAPTDEGRRLYVGGLPHVPNKYALNAEMRSLFQGWNIQAVSKIIPPPEHMQHLTGSHYYCFVDLPTSREANDAVAALHGRRTPHGGTYKVEIGSRSRRPTKVMREQLGVINREGKIPGPRKRDFNGSWRRLD